MAIRESVIFQDRPFRVDPQKQRFFETASPLIEPVTRDEAKTFARIVTASEDTLIDALIVAARITAEKWTNRVFIQRTYELFLDKSPMSQVMEFPLSPLLTVEEVSSFARDDTETTFDASNYRVDTAGSPPRIVLKESGTWPTSTRNSNSFRVQFTPGYGLLAADVPNSIREAIKILFAHVWELRGQIEESTDKGTAASGSLVGRMPMDAVMLLSPFRVEYFE